MNNQQIENTQEMKLPHEQARDLFMSIQKQSGAAIKPIGVFQFFYKYITQPGYLQALFDNFHRTGAVPRAVNAARK